jgi:acyl transferase domain-containing protein
VTALQLAILAVFKAAGVSCQAVVGHSSGEIAAAVAAGSLTSDQAILIAYYRGKATSGASYEAPVGMMAVGLGPDTVQPHLEGTAIQVACINSPQSVTLSGKKSELVELEKKLKDEGHFARLLLVDAAYHSRHMMPVASQYRELLLKNVQWIGQGSDLATVFSSTTGKIEAGELGPDYWVKNMVSPVLFSQAIQKMITQENAVDLLIEIGPSNALMGPVNQVKKSVSSTIEYTSAWKRGSEALRTMLELSGKLFNMGYPISLAPINRDNEASSPSFITDLPNYSWNHSVKYWGESQSSTDWRFRKFVTHDLLGSKILGTPWTHPTWKKTLRLNDITWLRDHVVSANSFLSSQRKSHILTKKMKIKAGRHHCFPCSRLCFYGYGSYSAKEQGNQERPSGYAHQRRKLQAPQRLIPSRVDFGRGP